MKQLTVGSLFAGIGGFDLGFERAGCQVVWQVDNDKFCRRLLEDKWPGVKRYGDIREIGAIEAVDVVCGGDPCPSRSLARGGRPSISPDLAGYYLAVVGRLRPRWVVRENVPAPDVVDFAACLELLGYRADVIQLDSADFTGQSRKRQFCIGCPPAAWRSWRRVLVESASDIRHRPPYNHPRQARVIQCLTTKTARRMDADQTLCYEHGRGLRGLTPEECEALQGFPRGWTAGFAPSRRGRMIGKAVTVDVVEWIAQRLVAADSDCY